MPTITDKAKRDLNIAFAKLLAMAGFTFAATDDATKMGDIIQSGLDAMGTLASTDGGDGASRVGVEDSAGYFTATTVEGVLTELYEAIQSGVSQATMAVDAATELTIASGAVTATQTYHTLDTEADAASDDLDTINGISNGEFAVLKLANAARNVVLKHNTGNIACPFGQDVTLDAANDLALAFGSGSTVVVLGLNLASTSGGGLGALLASTSASKGASLVGIQDSDSIYTAAQVEAALAEVMKKANAALGAPICVPVILSKHADNSVAARFTPGFAGKIRKITASVVDPVTTADKAATFTPAVAGSAVTGGALALTSANCATVGAKIDGSAITAGNAFTAAQEITVVASSVTAFAEGQVVVYLFLDPAT